MFYDKYLNSKNRKVAFITRLILFALIFLITLGVLYFVFGNVNFSKPYSYLLSASFSQSYIVQPYEDYSGFVIEGEMINIESVCTGWFELAVFIALMFAVIDISLKKRLLGILLLIPLFLIFNFSRIYLIVFSIMNYDLGFVDILHTMFFKVGLFLFFGIFFYLWLRFSQRD